LGGVANTPGNAGYVHHIFRCFRLLSPKARFMFSSILIFQALVSVLDLLGLAVLMKIVLRLQSETNNIGDSTIAPLSFLESFLPNTSSEVLLILVVVLFISKGFLALFLHTLNIGIMASETIRLVRRLSNAIFTNKTNKYSHLSNQDISYSLHNSTEIVFRDTLVPASIIVSDLVLLILISLNLFVSVQILFAPTVLYFLIIFITLRRLEKRITKAAYSNQWQSEVKVRRQIQEVYSSLREIYVSNKLEHFITKINQSRSDGIQAGAIVSIANLRPKYLYEMALFGGIGVIALVSKLSGNENLILIYLTIFLFSSSRMIPSLLRTQYYTGILQKSTEQSNKIFEILETSPSKSENIESTLVDMKANSDNQLFLPYLTVNNLTFAYGVDKKNPTVCEISLKVSPGETVAIIGDSGAGKSTLVDLLLGYLSPDSGNVTISGLVPRDSFEVWPGKVSYVPQKVTIYEGTLFENIAIGFTGEQTYHHDKVWDLLQGVDLGPFVESLKHGLHTQLSEFGSSLSGGQVQRIGIARALFTDPQLIVFDESTSSLDSVSEQTVMDYLFGLKGDKTLIIVAHRLSSIKKVDKIFYLKHGKLVAEGTFENLRENFAEFNQQILLQNIDDIPS